MRATIPRRLVCKVHHSPLERLVMLAAIVLWVMITTVHFTLWTAAITVALGVVFTWHPICFLVEWRLRYGIYLESRGTHA